MPHQTPKLTNKVKQRIFIRVIFIFMLVTGTMVYAAEENETTAKSAIMNELVKLANEQMAQDDGKRYWWEVFDKLDKVDDDELMACVSKKNVPSEMYRYLLEIGTGGTINAVHWEKSDDFTKCIDAVLMRLELPTPPVSPFYFYLTEI